MTTVSMTSTAAPQLSARTVRSYAGDWALFTDWCPAVGEWAAPSGTGHRVFFLTDCPAAPATHRRRVAAIDHHHTAAGYPRPGDSNVVRAALGRPVPDTTAAPAMSEQVAAALRGLPSHGWTSGMFGRRDRCLLVLSQLAGVPHQAPRHIDCRGHHHDRRDRSDREHRRAVDGRTRPRTPCSAGRAPSSGGSGSWTWCHPAQQQRSRPSPEEGEGGDRRFAAPVPIHPPDRPRRPCWCRCCR